MDADVIAAIRSRAQELAADAPPLTSEQAHLLVSLFSKYPTAGAGES